MAQEVVKKEARRLGIIGDVHAEDVRLENCLSYLANQGCKKIVCTGDIIDGPGCPNRSVELLKAFDVVTVRGNHDRWIIENKARHVKNAHNIHDLSKSTLDYLSILPLQEKFMFGGIRVLLCHGVGKNDLKKVWPGTDRLQAIKSNELDQIIGEEKFDYVINGHIHFRTMVHFKKLILINAGTISGDFSPGCTMIDFDENMIYGFLFEGSNLQLSKSQNLYGENYTIWENTKSFNGKWDPVTLF
mgnify:FL=1